ncbi:CynX/NimT family MFS transporter [Promicromonospora thailandica]|uniref:MFS transporter, CP family, cyanate transporter n=1 Tax=Promicromonospora thailandica TaxID=765201 RepID=A0A9X2G818_9MICO|nr:MFS transporter [Promicromonospora thailandica]MCP2267443.1 MFS transporter, CP family, cyanate transporter [Promicromonospora thailandica]
MPDGLHLPIWAGRTAALLGIVLVAFTLRQAVAAISPILDAIRTDIPISNIGVGLLGTLPPILFATSGFVAPRIARGTGLDGGIVLALVLMTAGHLVRSFAPGVVVLLVGSVVAFAGTGIGNVLLPSIVRRYFPDRIALLTAVYSCIVGVSTAVPAALAAPLAEQVGWRFSLGIWSVTSVVALVPWLLVIARERRRRLADAVEPPRPARATRLWRSRAALSITAVFSTSTICTYAVFAWLPEILGDVAGSTPTEAGVLLAVTGLISVPGALVAPLLAERLRNVGGLIAVGIASFVLGYLGLLLAPEPLTLLWVLLIGSGSILFPASLVLINSRTRTPGGTVSLSGFAQGVAYALGALGPLLVGLLHDVTGGWTSPLLFLVAVALVATVPAITLARPAFVEDELDR